MKFDISVAPTLIVCGTILGVTGNSLALWVFFGTGLFASLCSFAMDQSEKQAQQKKAEESIDQLKEAASDFGKAFGRNFKNFGEQ